MSIPAGYSGRPLAAKLGITEGHRVLLDGGPPGVDLGPLPPGCAVHLRARASSYDVAVLFARDRARLERRWEAVSGRLGPAQRLWVAWPKRSSGLQTDLDENLVRDHGLTHGRVDIKVCAVDATWSGLCFVVRLRDR